MSVISLPWFKESRVVYIFFKFLMLCKLHIKCFEMRNRPKQGKKATEDWYKIFLLNIYKKMH